MKLPNSELPRDAYRDAGVCLVLGVGELGVHRTFVKSAFIEYLQCEVIAYIY